ncbi:MAG: ABC transporter substrate-binding protein [Comamonadaceae bacterium]|nr:MAG: ABC transporter substrate-binding protein [Comamonadaceae bacterium]
MTAVIRGISSMATRQLLNELAGAYRERAGVDVAVESVGGVDAAKRVAAGEAFDFVVLASDAIDKLVAGGSAVPGTRTDIVLSSVAIAVREGAPKPDVASEEALRTAVLAAPTVGYSTGPSGTALMQLFERWGVAAQLRDRLVQARPGVPVGSMVASGEVALGFQQLSELVNLPGIAVIGGMPDTARIDTIFSGAVCSASTQADAARALLAFMASADTADAKRRNGMDAA